MGWKNVLNLLKEGKSGKAVSKASLEDGVKDPTEVGRKNGARQAGYKDMEGNVFKDKIAKEAESKRRQDSIPDEMEHEGVQDIIASLDRGDQQDKEHYSDWEGDSENKSYDSKKEHSLAALRKLRMRFKQVTKKKPTISKDDEPMVER